MYIVIIGYYGLFISHNSMIISNNFIFSLKNNSISAVCG